MRVLPVYKESKILCAFQEGIVNFLQHQRDLSADIKLELENSLRRLRLEAHSLLDLSAKLTPSKYACVFC